MLRSQFHLDFLERVVVLMPVIPIDAFASGSVCATKVQTIQVGVMTALVPPGSLVPLCTLQTVHVIVTVLRAERHASMTSE